MCVDGRLGVGVGGCVLMFGGLCVWCGVIEF